jgi:dehydrogenase/reductase SDR family member 1
MRVRAVRRATVLAICLHVAHSFCPTPVLRTNAPQRPLARGRRLHAALGRRPLAAMDWGPQVRGLPGKVCLVTGASKGIGKGIATALGEQGAKVYITGRSLERLEATAAAIRERGGTPVPVCVDHSEQAEIEALFKKISEEEGKLDILVNNCFAAVDGIFNNQTRGQKFWERDLSWFDVVNNVGLKAHFIASQLAIPLMLPSSTKGSPGLIVHVSSFGGLLYLFDVAYGVGKAALDRMAQDMAVELREHNIAAVSLWPGGAVVTETIQSLVLNDPIVMESKTLKDLLPLQIQDPASLSLNLLSTSPAFMKEFDKGESPLFVGRAVCALARMSGGRSALEYSGKVVFTSDLADEFGFTEEDGSKPKSYRSVSRLLDEVVPGLGGVVPRVFKIPAPLIGLFASKF